MSIRDLGRGKQNASLRDLRVTEVAFDVLLTTQWS